MPVSEAATTVHTNANANDSLSVSLGDIRV